MKHYNFKEIKERGNCIDFIEQVLGIPVRDGRCVAAWRDGSRDSVAIDSNKWFDHAEQQGGGIIELCARTKFGGTGANEIQHAQEFLGEWLHLEEVKLRKNTSSGHSRYDELIAEGYTEKTRYEYRDLQGKLIYFVCRLEHPEKKKEFLQGTPDHWGIADITPIPYNWNEVNSSDWCCIVEGEKDVETLKSIGVPATTNSGGAKKWRKEFSEYLRGKKVVIIPDNDEVGEEHARMIADDLTGVAESVKIVRVSNLPKGDVTDYMEKEGGSYESLIDMFQQAKFYDPNEMSPVERAKEANKKEFQNFWLDDTNPKRPEKKPRQINDLIADLHTRLIGAPFRVGEELFDRDHDTGKISYIYDAADLCSWIGRKTKHPVVWAKIDGCVTKQEFFSGLKAEAKCYSAISFSPDYPAREDVFYTHGQIPSPSKDHQVFRRFVDFFNPVDDINKSLLTAFIMAPIYYKPMVGRPLWIIDSPNGQGSGKSKIPEMVAYLYGSNDGDAEPIDVTMFDLERNTQEVIKRVISTKGRNARILRIDNVMGTLRSPVLASMVTTSSITGRASYGRGEESRPNNLTYVVTVNGCTVDTDLASRAYYLMVAKPKLNPGWVDKVRDYIKQNRLQIFADIIDIISSHEAWDIQPQTRVPGFETTILQAACGTPEQFQRVINFIVAEKEETNTDEEMARRIEEEITQRLISVKTLMGRNVIDPKTERVFIRSHVLESWFRNETWIGKQSPAEIIRGMAKTGMLPEIDPQVRRFPHHDSDKFKRRSGILWNPHAEGEDTRVVALSGDDKSAVEIAEG